MHQEHREPMGNITNLISSILPERIANIIRPVYGKVINLCRPPRPERHSNVTIRSYGDFEVAYRKETADELIIAHSFDQDIFFSGVPEYKPADNHVIIDVGAHIGTFSLLASSKVPGGKVYAIEPCEDSFNFLRINVALNKATNISVHHLALSDKEGICTLYYNLRNWGHSTVKRVSQYSETVEAWSLTKFLEINNIDKCQFMKMNCEGAEFPILLNTHRDILQRFETILVLYHCHFWVGNTEADLLSHLHNCGFDTIIRNQSEDEGWIIATNNY